MEHWYCPAPPQVQGPYDVTGAHLLQLAATDKRHRQETGWAVTVMGLQHLLVALPECVCKT